MTNSAKTFRIAGVGGQGIVLAGYIIGRAVAIYENKYALFTQQYGPAARGSNCYSSVIVADEPIVYPVIDSALVYISMSHQAFIADRNDLLTADTMLFFDAASGQVASDQTDFNFCLEATSEARKLGARVVANMIMLGYMTAVCGVITKEAMVASIRTSVPQRYVDINLTAFEQGFSLHSVT